MKFTNEKFEEIKKRNDILYLTSHTYLVLADIAFDFPKTISWIHSDVSPFSDFTLQIKSVTSTNKDVVSLLDAKDINKYNYLIINSDVEDYRVLFKIEPVEQKINITLEAEPVHLYGPIQINNEGEISQINFSVEHEF